VRSGRNGHSQSVEDRSGEHAIARQTVAVLQPAGPTGRHIAGKAPSERSNKRVVTGAVRGLALSAISFNLSMRVEFDPHRGRHEQSAFVPNV
jgi:hypothetical protein